MSFPGLSRRLALGLLLLASASHASVDDGAAPRDVLEGKGIRVFSSHLALAGESELGEQFRDADKLKRDLRDSRQKLAAVEQKIAQNQRLLDVYRQKRIQFSEQLRRTAGTAARNQIIAAMNELGDRIGLLIENGGMESELKAARDGSYTARETYVQAVVDLGKSIERLRKAYTDLGVDSEVQAAIEGLNKESGKSYELAESRSFQRHQKDYQRLAETVLSDSVDLRRSPEGTLFVAAMINSKHSAEMAVDSGSTAVILPHALAVEVGLEPKPEHPVAMLTLADGKTVIEVRQIRIPSLRIGKFEVEQVEAGVLPEHLKSATPILGQTFLRNFNFKINSDSGTLELIRVDDPESNRNRPDGVSRSSPE